VSESSDSDNADSIRGSDVELDHRIENGYASTEKRTDCRGIHVIRYGKDPRSFSPDTVGKSPVVIDDDTLAGPAQVVIASRAPLTGHAGRGIPTDPDAIAR